MRLNFDPRDPLLAAAAWSRLTEPGDAVAHTLVEHLGAADALAWFEEQATGLPPSGSGLPATLGCGDGPAALSAAVARWASRLPLLDPPADLEVLRRLGGTLITPELASWPRRLDDLGQGAPFALWLLGDPKVLEALERSVALVGARAATAYGEQVAASLAGGLTDRRFAVVSGGAYGIDAAAHRGSLAAGGVTVAVMAGGVDRLYPRGNLNLIESIERTGLIISEVPPDASPMKQRFLSRNRLIAALTGATVVVEAAWRSGALSTARHAASLLRPVGAVPGPVTSMASAGCNQLLRDGVAVCVTDAAEAAELAGTIGGDLLGPAPPGAERLGLDRAGSDRPGSDRSEPGLPGATVARPSDGLDPTSLAVLDSLPARGLITLERLVAEAGQPLPAVLAALGLLELRGLVRADGPGWRLGGPGGAGASAGSVGVGSPGGAGASRVSAGGGGPGGAAIPGRAGPRRQTGSDE